jgi:hypothetical protein
MPGFDFPNLPNPGDQYTYGSLTYEYNGYAWVRQGQNLVSPPEGVPDGDKGDIIVSGGGYVWLFDTNVVTAAGRAILDDANAAAQRVTLGLGNVDNTSDANKPINAATQAALNNKYDKTGGPISGAVTVQADLAVSNGRIINYGAGGSPEQSYYFLNQSGSKSLYNDGIQLNLNGTPFKVTSTAASSFAGALSVGGALNVTGAATVSGTMNVVGQITTRSLVNVDGAIFNRGLSGNTDASVIYMNGANTKYLHQDGVNFNFVGSQAYFADATDASSPSAAAVKLAGGLGVAKAIRAGSHIVAGANLYSTGYVFAGSSGTHYLGPGDANTEYHVYAAGHNWSYNRSTGNLVWSNGSGSGLIIYDNGVLEPKSLATAGTIYAAGSIDVGPLNVRGAVTCSGLTCNGNLAAARIDGTDIYASGVLTAGANVAAYNDTYYGFIQGGGYRYQHFASNFYWLYNQGTGDLNWTGPGGQMFAQFRSDAALILAFQKAYMPGGGPWGDSSDERIKNVQGDYELGLDAIRQLQPVRYTFKGNDTSAPPAPVHTLPHKEPEPMPKSAPYPNSPHYGVSQSGQEFVGLIAQEVETIFPGMVTQRVGFIDGQEVTDLRDLNTSELIFALVNAVKTLAARVEALETPV